jgi:non-ribosomal peptide synthetase component F
MQEHSTICSYQLFEAQAVAHPGATALISGGVRVTYSALNEWANDIADDLARRGAGRGDVAGVCMRNSPAVVATLLGIFKAGAAFVPLDPSFPQDRLRFMMADAGSRLLLTSEDLTMRMETYFTREPGIKILPAREPSGGRAIREYPNLHGEASPEDTACILYTSGSTGRPKGAIRTHRGIVARLAWARPELDDILCHNMSICYGFSQERLFVPLTCGTPLAAHTNQPLSLPALHRQASFPIDPPHALMIHALVRGQHHVQSTVAEPWPLPSQLYQLLAQLAVIPGGPIPVRRDRQLQQPAGAPLTEGGSAVNARQMPSSLRAPTVFSNHRLQSIFIQRQVGDQPLQSPVLIPQLLGFLRFADLHAAVLGFPGVQRMLADADLARHIFHFSPGFHLL